MSDLSVFVDESGSQEGRSAHYIVTCVFHNQDFSIEHYFRLYEESLARKGLPDIPFHANPLMRGNDSYSCLSIEERKYLLMSFNMTVQKLPIRYSSFSYRNKEFVTPDKLKSLIEHDLVTMIVENLEFFQSFDWVKVYYDKGQRAVADALELAFGTALSKQAISHRESGYRNYRLAQVADYLCAIELAFKKYEHGEQTATDIKFFGGIGQFKKNWLKQARRLSI